MELAELCARGGIPDELRSSPVALLK